MRYVLALIACLAALPLWAAPVEYRLDQPASTVAFGYEMAGQPGRGAMPVKSAEIWLDIDRIRNSRVTATLDPTKARTSLFFATQAMRGPLILDTKTHPEIVFRSTRVSGTATRATVEGEITIKNVTRPITLTAQLFRERGAPAGSRDRLSILLRGQISRSAFGASGYPGFVGDTVTLDILARIDRAK